MIQSFFASTIRTKELGAHIAPSLLSEDLFFGQRIALSPDGVFLAVSASGFQRSSNYVFVYERVNGVYTQSQIIEDNTAAYFGESLAFGANNKLLISDTYFTDTSAQNGRVYMYGYNGSNFVLQDAEFVNTAGAFRFGANSKGAFSGADSVFVFSESVPQKVYYYKFNSAGTAVNALGYSNPTAGAVGNWYGRFLAISSTYFAASTVKNEGGQNIYRLLLFSNEQTHNNFEFVYPANVSFFGYVFSTDGTKLFTSSSDGILRVYEKTETDTRSALQRLLGAPYTFSVSWALVSQYSNMPLQEMDINDSFIIGKVGSTVKVYNVSDLSLEAVINTGTVQRIKVTENREVLVSEPFQNLGGVNRVGVIKIFTF